MHERDIVQPNVLSKRQIRARSVPTIQKQFKMINDEIVEDWAP